MRRTKNASATIFFATLALAVASAAATLAPEPTPNQTAGATLEAIAALSPSAFAK
jgi:hypothetical protein